MIYPAVSKYSKCNIFFTLRLSSCSSFPQSFSTNAGRTDYGLLACAFEQIWSMASSSSGMTTALLSAFRRVTGCGHCCALVDVGGYFDPINADSAGIDLKRLLWVRCIHKANAQSKSSKNQSSSNANAEISGTSIGPSEIHQKRLRSVPQIPSYIVRTPGVDEQQLKPTRQLLCASQERSSGMRKVLDAREDGVNACTRRDESYSSKVNNSKKQRLNPLEQAFKAADILIQNGG